MHFSALYCIHCRRYFIGSAAKSAARHHMRHVHGKEGSCGSRNNIRYASIEVEASAYIENQLCITNVDGVIEVCNSEREDTQGVDQ